MDKKILEISDLKKKYNSKFCLDVNNLYAEKGKILTIIGPNGSGKSTLIRLINLLERPDEGKIYFNGHEITNGEVSQTEVRKKMAVVFQEPLLFNTSVYTNIIMGLKIRNIKLSGVKDRIDYFTGKLKITDLLNRSTKNLSGGEKQRVSLARALVLDPELLLLDEPLANIDQSSRESLRADLFGVLRGYGKSVVYVTHDRNEAMVLADDIEVFVVSQERRGTRVTLAIRPEDVILYSTEISSEKSSAMNLFKGKITEIRDIGIFKRIEIDCGFPLSSFVTQNSVNRLKLALGKEITAAVKASSIHMFKR